eukprot:gene4277-5410_t
MDIDSARYAMEVWDCPANASKLETIRVSEVGISKKLLDVGYNIASTALHRDVDFRLKRNKYCGLDRNIGLYFNPYVCHNASVANAFISSQPRPPKDFVGRLLDYVSPPMDIQYKCKYLDPCDTVFVKYGGEAFSKGLMTEKVVQRMLSLDELWREQERNAGVTLRVND